MEEQPKIGYPSKYMKAIPIVACLFLILGMALSVEIAVTPYTSTPRGPGIEPFGYEMRGKFSYCNRSLITGAFFAFVWGVILVRGKNRAALRVTYIAVLLVLIPVMLNWQSRKEFDRWKEIDKPNLLDAETVTKIYHTPARTTVPLGALSIILMCVSLSLESVRLRRVKEDSFANSKYADELRRPPSG